MVILVLALYIAILGAITLSGSATSTLELFVAAVVGAIAIIAVFAAASFNKPRRRPHEQIRS